MGEDEVNNGCVRHWSGANVNFLPRNADNRIDVGPVVGCCNESSLMMTEFAINWLFNYYPNLTIN
jgi:hypothetical protein